jgi:hypothetical protein
VAPRLGARGSSFSELEAYPIENKFSNFDSLLKMGEKVGLKYPLSEADNEQGHQIVRGVY